MADNSIALFSGESEASENLKLVKVARQLRFLQIKNTHAHISIQGFLSSRLLLLPPDEVEKERYTLEGRIWDKRDSLIQYGVPEGSIAMYVPFQMMPVSGWVMQIDALDSAPKPSFPRTNILPGLQPFDPSVSTSVIIDPKAKNEVDPRTVPGGVPHRTSRTVESQIEISVWDNKGHRNILVPKMTVSINVGPNKFEEAGAELTALKVTLKDLYDKEKMKEKILWGTISNLQIALKVGGTVNLDKSTASRLIREWTGKVKVAVAAELGIPGTKIKIPVEASVYVDHEGQPGWGLQIVVFEF